ncbi:ImmA/IrrE family metallo-endopeptidase [Natroniella sulfidigena]|uniref:ImmA/IrrE family metallo-endopeptidase n=1 Tax=Natroniella sulfidigena TaxID=723921 RepID=UPI00200B42D5|nr:ImmA/IrrE family metallo-endopeptidase [Natroniella sulfidigena]MCK8817177.1 ImmA/IrrE family metallo-endopeptidase [Natroniella sulfidigena]
MDFELIESQARNFLKKHNLTVPVKLNKATNILNIEIKEVSYPVNSAILYKGHSKNLIVIGKQQSLGQKRFNIAYGIAHVLPQHQEEFFTSNLKKNKPLKEKEADVFASELLIPTPVLKQKAAKFNYNINKLAEFFKVTRQAILTKLKIKDIPYCHDQQHGNFF